MLQIDSVSKLYKGGDKALDNISFSVEQGEFISVIGKSGAGKTTLFRLLNGMIKPTAGRIIINNQDFTKLKGRKKRDIQKTIGTIYQDFCLVDTITCLDNVLNGALADRNAFQALFGIFTKEQKEYARKLVIEGRIRRILKQYGYDELQTPSFEFFDIFGKEIGTTPSKAA